MFDKEKKYVMDNHKVNDIKWEDDIRIEGSCVRWYTEVMPTDKADNYLKRIREKECEENYSAFCSGMSSTGNGDRVWVLFQDGSMTILDIYTPRLNKIVDFLNLVHDPEGKKRWSIDLEYNSVKFTGPGNARRIDESWGQRKVAIALIGAYKRQATFGNLAKLAGFTQEVIEEFKKSVHYNVGYLKTDYRVNKKFLPTLMSLAENFEAICKRFDQAVASKALEHLFPLDVGRVIGTFLNGRHRLAETRKSAHQAGQDALNPNNNNSLKM